MAKRGGRTRERDIEELESLAPEDESGNGLATHEPLFVPASVTIETRPPRSERPHRPRRWAWLGIVVSLVVVAALLISIPVRSRFSTRAFDRIEQGWLTVHALEEERQTQVRRITPLVTAEDRTAAENAMHQLDTEEAEALDAVRHRLDGLYVPDSDVRSTRDRVTEYIGSLSNDRRRHGPTSAATDDARLAAHRSLTALATARGAQPARLETPAPDLHAADKLLAMLGHFLDAPTGVRLVATDGDQFRDIDLDANREIAVLPDGFEAGNAGADVLVRRNGYIGFISEGTAYAMEPSVAGPVTALGTAVNILPSVRSDALWLIPPRAGGPNQATEVGRAGAVLSGPFDLPGRPVAAVSGGLVIVPDNGQGLQLWDTATRRVSRQITVNGSLMAASENLVAWLDFDGPLGANRIHLTPMDGGEERVVDGPGGMALIGTGQFSPDGRRLASIVAGGRGITTQALLLSVIDLDTLRTEVIEGPLTTGGVTGMVWTLPSDRVFITTANPLPIATWKLGDRQIHQVRLPMRRLLQVTAV